MKSNKTYDEYLVSVIHVESDEVVKMIKVFSTEKAISVRGNLEARYGRDYEVNIAILNIQAVSKGQGMIERPTRYVNEFNIKKHIQQECRQNIDEMSANEVIDFLFGDYTDRGEFRIVDDCYCPDEKWWHRLNTLWAYPLTLACSPYRYVVYGHTGWDDKTRFGNWILRMTGHR